MTRWMWPAATRSTSSRPSSSSPSAATSAAGRPIVSNSAMPVGIGGWCIATIVGVPSSASASHARRSSPKLPAGLPGTSVSHMRTRTPSQSTAYCRNPSVAATPGWSANASRSASRSSWLPGIGWTGTVSGARSSRTRAYERGSPSSVRSPVTRTASGCGSSATSAATARLERPGGAEVVRAGLQVQVGDLGEEDGSTPAWRARRPGGDPWPDRRAARRPPPPRSRRRRTGRRCASPARRARPAGSRGRCSRRPSRRSRRS